MSTASSGADEPGEEDQGTCCGGSAVCRIGGAFLARLLSGVIGSTPLNGWFPQTFT